MIIDPLRPTTNFASWWVTLEYTDTEDNQLIDFSLYPNIKVEIIDPTCNATVMTLTRANDVIMTPSKGIIEWYVPKNQMSGLCGTYNVHMYVWGGPIETEDETVALMDSSVSIVGNRSQ